VKVLATYAIKGGVGKTSAAVNLAYLAAQDGLRTLLWDLDPQGSATFLFRVRPRVRGGGRALVQGRLGLDEVIKETDFEGLDLMPADFSLRHLDLELDGVKHPTRRLRQLLQPLRKDYDLVVLDCPPNLSLVSEGVVEAADLLLVPVVPAVLSVRTLDQLAMFLAGTAGKGTGTTGRGRRPRVLGFLSLVDRRKRLHRELVESLPKERDDVCEVVVPALTVVERMAELRLPVPVSDPRSAATLAYRQLWDVVRRELGGFPAPGPDED